MGIILSFLLLFSSIYATENAISLEKQNENLEKNYYLNSFFSAIKFSNNSLAMAYIGENESKNQELNIDNKAFSPAFEQEEVYEESDINFDINAQNENKETAVMIAIEYKNNYILKELLKKGVNLDVKHPVLGKYPIHTAVYFENYEAVELLLKYNKKFANLQNDVDGWTPLEDAALKGNVQITKLLLSYGANPSLKDYSGNDAIDLAANYGKGAIVKLLRDNLKQNRK